MASPVASDSASSSPTSSPVGYLRVWQGGRPLPDPVGSTLQVYDSPYVSPCLSIFLYLSNQRHVRRTVIYIYADKELVIGRNYRSCDAVIPGDMAISNKHLRIYTIIFDKGNPGEVGPLVYAKNLARFGSIWNSLEIMKDDPAVLLSDKDELKLSPLTVLSFHSMGLVHRVPFSEAQRKEMKRFEKRYKVSDRLLGCGAYGRVYMAVSMKHKKQLACKIIDLGNLRKRLQLIKRGKHTELRAPRPAAEVDVEEETEKVKYWAERRQEILAIEAKLRVYEREVDILKDLDHPNIIRLEQVIRGENTMYIFQELVTAGDLFSFLEYKQFNLSDSEAAVIVRQVALAIRYLHRNNVVHRDIKPDNVLMTSLSNGARVVLTDFGCARRLENESCRMKTSIGTFEYTAPEVPQSASSGKGRGYTKAVDMWSLGCLTVVLLTGGSPFIDLETGQYSHAMARNCDLSALEQEEDWRRVGLRAKDFVRKLLILDENVRMTAEDAVSHKWFTNPTYNAEFVELYRRVEKQWRPKERQVMSEQNIDDRTSTNNLTSWRKTGETPLEWPYIPYPHLVHQILYPQARAASKDRVREKLRCVDTVRQRRIYPYEDSRLRAPGRAGSPTFSEMELEGEVEGDADADADGDGAGAGAGDEKAETQSMDSVTTKGDHSKPTESNNDDKANNSPEQEVNGSRLRMPFSPDAWSDEPKDTPEKQQPQQPQQQQQHQHPLPEPISLLTRNATTAHIDTEPQPSLPELPKTPYLQVMKIGPIQNYQRDSNDGQTIRDIKLPHGKVHGFTSLARGIRACEASSCTNNNNDNDNVNRNDDNSEPSPNTTGPSPPPPPAAPSSPPRKINGKRRSIYDFLEDCDEDEVYEEIQDRISGKKRRIVYGGRDGMGG
ncbi:CAMK protein kinase [Blastomyces parvus]|uniref:CAMK protein kinase n=1 Tax=Blastomyces parvus TaxID=2060905 RepID=A0A2B7WZI1_9EURO|nr:CAMK protein kinase [Blastomyces parvus]